jgi:hypothetical protein
VTSAAIGAFPACVKRVHSFAELIETPFAGGTNALCWERELPGDFGEIITAVGEGEGLEGLDEEGLRQLSLSADGRVAADLCAADLRLLRAHGLAPVLDCIHGYPEDEEADGLPTDVFSFHADRAPVPADTYLCTYAGAASEGLRPEDARRRVDIPSCRAELRRRYGGADDAGFLAWLEETCHDLHYHAQPGARPYGFGLGHLWRIAIQYPGCPVPPCLHRAPATQPGRPRLLLIS